MMTKIEKLCGQVMAEAVMMTNQFQLNVHTRFSPENFFIRVLVDLDGKIVQSRVIDTTVSLKNPTVAERKLIELLDSFKQLRMTIEPRLQNKVQEGVKFQRTDVSEGSDKGKPFQASIFNYTDRMITCGKDEK